MKKLLVCLLVSIFVCTSCGMGEEIDTLGIVVGAAFDKPEEDGNINMTACILRVNGEGGGESGESGGGGSKEYVIVNSEAPSFYEAQSRMMLKVERRPFWGHNNIILVSQDVDLKPIVEAFYNGYDKRGSEYVVVVKDNAGDTFQSANFMGNVGAVSINEILGMTNQNAYLTDVSVHEFYSRMNSRSHAAYLPYGETGDEKFIFSGMCVVRDFQFLDELSQEESIGSLIVQNEFKSGGISVPLGTAKAGVDLMEASCTMECSRDMVFDIKVKASYSVEDLNGDTDMSNAAVSKLVNEYIKGLVDSAIQKSIELDADFMGFENDYFDEFAADMPGALADAKFNVTVDGKLKFKGIEY